MEGIGLSIVYSIKPSRGVLSGRKAATPDWMRGLKIERVFSPSEVSTRGLASVGSKSLQRGLDVDDADTLHVVKPKDLGEAAEIMERLLQDPSVAYAYPAPIRHILGRKDVSTASVGDWHEQIKLTGAKKLPQWRLAKHRVTVGLVDSGIDPLHPQLSHCSIIDHHKKKPSRPDPMAHGSHVAGLICALLDGSNKFCGVAEDVVDLEMHRGIAAIYDVASYYRALRAACESRVVNLSLGGTVEDPTESKMIARVLSDPHKIIVAAAGNEGEVGSPKNYPAACPGVIAVANVDRQGNRAATSNVNDYVFVAAPGENIISTVPTYRVTGVKRVGTPPLAEMSGTSMSAPIVTAIIARMLAFNPKLTREQVIDYIAKSSSQKRTKSTGHGCINVQAVLSLL